LYVSCNQRTASRSNINMSTPNIVKPHFCAHFVTSVTNCGYGTPMAMQSQASSILQRGALLVM
jgi:hypothetical protein